jgi:hypothetical protein
VSRPKAENLALCDALLERAEALERDLRTLARNMPPGVANTSAFITKTAECAAVTVARLNTAYNSIRRYDHG